MNGTDSTKSFSGGFMRKLPELLAPAGSLEHMRAAVKAGADAVYMGGEKFSARAYAENFSKNDGKEALRYAHFYGKKLYLTVNTLMKEREIQEELMDFLFSYYKEGLDGVIVQDMGIARFVRTYFPDMEVHASTQMTITDPAGARAAARIGMTRVVPARELSLSEIQKIKKESDLEVEVFVHGALCYCYSGQCLFSSLYGDRSGNRGRCSQPCRLPYRVYDRDGKAFGKTGKEAYPLSPKDLCALSQLPALLSLPVDSLKIEGRMKNVEYVAGVTAIYRKYLDELAGGVPEERDFVPAPEDVHRLEELYCRSSFTDGYGKRHNGREMMSVVSPKNTGRKIGKVLSVYKNHIRIQVDVPLAARDVLVLFLSGGRQEEIVLTVPEEGKLKKISGDVVELNAPESRRIRPGMAVYRRKSERLLKDIRENILEKEMKYPVDGGFTLKIGCPARLTLRCRGEEVTREGMEAEIPRKRPLTREDVLRQMNKTGNVPFTLRQFVLEMEENCFLPLSEIKLLRQAGFALLKEKLEERGARTAVALFAGEQLKEAKEIVSAFANKSVGEHSELSLPAGEVFLEEDCQAERNSVGTAAEKIAAVYDEKMFSLCAGDSFFDALVLSWEFFSPKELQRLARTGKDFGKKMYFSMPRVFRGANPALEKTCCADIWDGIYVYTVNEAQYLAELEKFSGGMIAAASFYEWNSFAAREIWELYPALKARELPAELSGREIKDFLAGLEGEVCREIPSELTVYGRVPVMQSAQCVKRTAGRCDKKPALCWLSDRKNRRLPVTVHCRDCYNLIWLDGPRSLIGEEFSEVAWEIPRRKFELFQVSPEELASLKAHYHKWTCLGFHRDETKENPDHHWNHGIL